MSSARYSDYKDSNLPWVGKIPAHWELKPFFTAFEERDERNKGMKEDNLLSLSYGRVIEKDINTADGLLPESYETYQIVESNDIVFRLTDLQNDKRSLRSAIVPKRGIITSAYLDVIPKSYHPRFAHYLFRSYDLSKVFYSMGGGLRQGMKYSDLRRLEVIKPPRDEQEKIATFLDHETSKIDALISEQQRLIELLKEKRQAVISQAVTKGLDPDAEMKDSGVTWLGKVPEHWLTRRLRFVVSLDPSRHQKIRRMNDDDVVSFLPMNAIGDDGSIDLTQAVELGSVTSGYTFFEENDVSVAKITPCFENGKGAVMKGLSNGLGFGTTELVILRPHEKTVDPNYLYFVTQLRAFRSLGESEMYGAGGQKRVPLNFIRDFRMGWPPFQEQKAIVNWLIPTLDRLSDLVDNASKLIKYLDERRSALISAAVTGKIDVRNWRPSKQSAARGAVHG